MSTLPKKSYSTAAVVISSGNPSGLTDPLVRRQGVPSGYDSTLTHSFVPKTVHCRSSKSAGNRLTGPQNNSSNVSCDVDVLHIPSTRRPPKTLPFEAQPATTENTTSAAPSRAVEHRSIFTLRTPSRPYTIIQHGNPQHGDGDYVSPSRRRHRYRKPPA